MDYPSGDEGVKEDSKCYSACESKDAGVLRVQPTKYGQAWT